MLEHMTDEHRFQLTAKMAQEVQCFIYKMRSFDIKKQNKISDSMKYR